jgi:hypothetical protein
MSVGRVSVEHDITDPTNPLGPEPTDLHVTIQYQHALELVERANPGHSRERDLDIER